MKEQTRTILAIVFCVIIITVSFMYQAIKQASDEEAALAIEQNVSVEADIVDSQPDQEPAQDLTVDQSSSSQLDFNDLKAINEDEISQSPFQFKTSFFTIDFDPAGASIKNLSLNNYQDNEDNLDIIFKTEESNNAFLLYFGDDLTTPIETLFDHKIENNKVIFFQDFTDSTGNEFTIYKTFEFRDSDYMFKVSVDIEAKNPLSGDYIYTLAVEPQVGPEFTQMKNDNYDYRKIYINTLTDKNKTKKVQVKYSDGEFETTKTQYNWIALSGKYFTILAMPDNDNYKFSSIERKNTSIPVENNMYFSKTGENSNSMSNSIMFYCGPQLKQFLDNYYSANDNEWGLKGLTLEDVMSSSSMFAWLENVLKWALSLLYGIIPNYGVAIILLTILIKLIFYPLTKKSTESTAKMSAINPQLKELQAKYKDNPQKLNQATSELYKEAHINPLSGCLPMLIQFPIFIALYGLLNNHFELRGSMFIPGWITDLSSPETIIRLTTTLPLVGNEIHLLPFIYTFSMIFSMKMSSSSQSGGANGQAGMMKMMTYGMPIVFFFVLYSAPSGLLLYWTVQNFITMIQQQYTNNKKKFKNAEFTEEDESKVPEVIKKYREKQKKLQIQQNKSNKDK